MMRVMVFMKSDEASERGLTPTPDMLAAFAAMDDFTEELTQAGVLIAAAGLKPSAEGKRIVRDGAASTVIDGPFAETRELVAGFSIWEVRDMDEAITWAKRSPMAAGGVIELRPFYEIADLGSFITAEEAVNPRAGDRGRLGVA